MALGAYVRRTKYSLDYLCEKCFKRGELGTIWEQFVPNKDMKRDFPRGFRCDNCGCDEHGNLVEMDN